MMPQSPWSLMVVQDVPTADPTLQAVWDVPKLFEYSVLGTLLLFMMLIAGRVIWVVSEKLVTAVTTALSRQATAFETTAAAVVKIADAADKIADEVDGTRAALERLESGHNRQCRAVRHAVSAMQKVVAPEHAEAHRFLEQAFEELSN